LGSLGGYLYSTCRFSQLFDLEMSLRQIFCSSSLAKCSDMWVREVFIFEAVAFFSRFSFRRIYYGGLKDEIVIERGV